MSSKAKKSTDILDAYKGALIFFTGKMGAGKSTKAHELAQSENAILISEDHWLAQLYPNEIQDFSDYITYSNRLKDLIKPHVQNLLIKGNTVIMDFPGNTKKQRQWIKGIYSEVSASHQLYYLKASDETCLLGIAKRKLEQPEREAFDTEDMFHRVTAHFEAPTEDEGFEVICIARF